MNMIPANAILCRYDEIAIKGRNRSKFEDRLVENLRRLARGVEDLKISRVRGRLWVRRGDGAVFPQSDLKIMINHFPDAFGLSSFSPGVVCAPEMTEIKRVVADNLEAVFEPAIKRLGRPAFRIAARRGDKSFPMTSNEVEIALADVVGERYGGEALRVDLSNPDVTLGCEIRHEFAFIYHETIYGPGGLPVGANSPVLALLSGGIDSPVACYMVMKRGCSVDYLTFHSSPYTPPETVDKVRRVAKRLNELQTPARLYVCNLSPVQKMIRDECAERFRTILYRRMMLRVAESLANEKRRMALATGEAIGQVASQTIENMNVINASVDMLVLRPLLGMNKMEVVDIACRIGTFNISKEQVPDSCTVFAPKAPATKSTVKRIIGEEEKLGDFNAVLNDIRDQIEVCVP